MDLRAERKKMELCTLASGSKGNSGFIRSENSSLLVDLGISTKRLCGLLRDLNENPENLKGILITHEHSDHILGLKTFLKKYRIPVFATADTFDAILKTSGYQNLDRSLLHAIDKEQRFSLGDIDITAFSIPHDAADPVGFTFQKDDRKIAVCTDIGMITDCITEHLADSNAMVVEANHDEHILQAGSYPYSLKKRILGDLGHLSNENSGKLLCKIWHKNLKHIFLGHLSEENNMPELALMSVKFELSELYREFEAYTGISVAGKDVPSEMILV